MKITPPIIGILGSGQLGRMIAIAADEMDIKAIIYAPDAKNSPAAEKAFDYIEADYNDKDSLKLFGEQITAVTTEFENVPASVLDILAEHCTVSPSAKALHIAQNRLREKQMAEQLGIKTPRYWQICCGDDLNNALSQLNGKGILKTTEQGYDGKGQITIQNGDNGKSTDHFSNLDTNEAILEEFIPFQYEVSFLVWRNRDNGEMGCFPATENTHKNGILARSVAPAPALDSHTKNKGEEAVKAIANHVDLHGVLAMEAFIDINGDLVFNEIAPRPHNSFHWTIEGTATSQFAQCVRLICGFGAGNTNPYGKFIMENLLGDDMESQPSLYADQQKSIHLYGKTQPRKGRKMGHITWQDLKPNTP